MRCGVTIKDEKEFSLPKFTRLWFENSNLRGYFLRDKYKCDMSMNDEYVGTVWLECIRTHISDYGGIMFGFEI